MWTTPLKIRHHSREPAIDDSRLWTMPWGRSHYVLERSVKNARPLAPSSTKTLLPPRCTLHHLLLSLQIQTPAVSDDDQGRRLLYGRPYLLLGHRMTKYLTTFDSAANDNVFAIDRARLAGVAFVLLEIRFWACVHNRC
jgi:hypothetical protein